MKFRYFKFGLLATVMMIILTITPSFTATSPSDASTMAGVQTAKWGSNVKISYSGNSFSFASNGIPNHSRPAEYALPPAGVMLPKPDNAYAGADPTRAQNYSFTIPLTPTKIAKPTSTSLGPIGIMISGAALFNPYEGDNKSVATFDNFSIKNSKGEDVPFLDLCNGHPTPMGQYHYHALPPCITQVVDKVDGPSHIIGVAFDGFPIYGDRAMDGSKLTASQLDSCNGITSPTPEFPKGFYHYVLLDTKDSTSSIRCLSGKSNITMRMPGMRPGGPGMPGMPRGPRPQLG
jgi:YHYH protein